MTKILIVVHKFWPSLGGLQRLSYNLATHLVKRGHTVTVYTSRSNRTSSQGYVDGVFVKRFPRIWLGSSWPDYAMPTMAVDMLTNKFDLVHSFDMENFQSLLASFLKSVTREPLVLNATLHPTHRVYKETAGRFVLDSADAIIVQCEQERRNLPSNVDSRRVFLVPCGIDSRKFSQLPDGRQFRQRHEIAQSDRVVLYVGPVGGQKSVPDLVSIMPRIVKSVERSRLVIIARGSDFGVLRNLARQGGISDRVTFLGKVDDEELVEAYAGADVFAFPSKHESFGIVLLEAAAAGLPIVSTKVGVAPELVQEGVNGYTCESCDNSFADRVIETLSQGKYQSNAESIRLSVLDRFDWSSVAGSLELAYSKVNREK